MKKFGIGQSVARAEDARLVRGLGKFTDDLAPQDALWMFVIRSPHGCAAIKGIDASAALAMPGVVAVLTGADVAADGLGYPSSYISRPGPDGKTNYVPPYPLLAHKRSLFAGEGVAIVLAETLNQAKSAAEAVVVDFEALECASTIEAAEAEGAPLVWEACPGNVCVLHDEGKPEEVAKAFTAAAHVAEVEFEISRVYAATIEPRSSIGQWDEAAQRYTLHTSSQGPHMARSQLANGILKVREDQVRVIAHDVGGGFGLKGMQHPEQALVLWAARKVGRAVRWTAERTEAFLADCHARDDRIRSELALDENGKFLAFRVHSRVNLGAYLSTAGVHCAAGNLGGAAGVYVIPAIHINVRALFSNSNPVGAYRGAGRPEASMMIERVIDVAARQIGLDPAELRRRNLIPAEAMPYDTGFLFTYDSGDFPTGQAKAEAMADWAGFPARRAEALKRGKLRGIGMAHVIEIAAPQLDETADISVEPSGSVVLTVGTHSQGQGHETTMRQIVTEVLGVAPERVRVVFGDTDAIGSGFGAAGSRTAVIAGHLLQTIGTKVIGRGKEVAASLLECQADEVDFDDGVFTARATNRTAGWDEVARRAHEPMHLPQGSSGGWSSRMMVRLPGPTFPNACHICEVEIDIETGQTETVGYWICEDIGKAINPMIVKGQVHGGIVQGIGQAFWEQIRYDENGQLLTASFMDYQMPRAADIPNIAIESNDVPSLNNPLGIKGVGEGGTVGGMSAGVNAVCDALAPLGIENFNMPATPFRVWQAIRNAPKSPSTLGCA